MAESFAFIHDLVCKDSNQRVILSKIKFNSDKTAGYVNVIVVFMYVFVIYLNYIYILLQVRRQGMVLDLWSVED